MKIVETVSGSITSTKQFVGPEERDANGDVSTKFFAGGQVTGASLFYYTKDQLGSVREMCDDTGASQALYAFDLIGRPTKLEGAEESDVQFGGMYIHRRSGLSLASYREFSAKLGRWLSRDPIGEDGGSNLYAYGANDPVGSVDPSGLLKFCLSAQKGRGLAGFLGYRGYQGPPIGPPVYPPIDTGGSSGSGDGGGGGDPSFGPVAGPPIKIPGSNGQPTWHWGPIGSALSQMSSDDAATTGFYTGMATLGGALAGGMMAASSGGGGGGGSSGPTFIVTPGGTAYPVPTGATGPVPTFVRTGATAGSRNGSAFVGGRGGANGQVRTMRIMDPKRGASRGYIKYENANEQGVNPYTGRTGSDAETHFMID